MNWIFKNKKTPSEKLAFLRFFENKKATRGKRTKGLLLAFFLVSGFLFSVIDVSAATTRYRLMDESNKVYVNGSGKSFSYNTIDECNTTATELKATGITVTCQSFEDTTDPNSLESKVDNFLKSPGEVIGGLFTAAIKNLLGAVLVLLGWLLTVAASLFEWVVTPANVSGNTGTIGLLNRPEVRNVWIMVRDTLNMTFIMVLLFAAFCTVFQVDSWNLKKVWLSILINALLVNFSFPIARIFIDISNVAMYYFLNHLFTGTGGGSGSAIMASFSDQSKLGVILKPGDYASYELTYLIVAIIFTFILAVTLLVLAVLFVIRLIALTMLLMFSPIGFVGNIFPETKKFASDWWSNLFKYAFFGPIMVFMMMVALTIMKAMPTTFSAAASKNTLAGVSSDWIGSMAFYSIPIIILWTAMGISQSMGIAGASAVVGRAQKFARAGLMKMSGAKFVKDTFGAYQARRKQGDAEKLSNRFGKFLGSQQDRLRGSVDGVPIIGGRGAKQANQRYQADAAAEAAAAGKLHDTVNMTEVDLKELSRSSDKFERAAALLELAARGKADAKNVDEMKREFGDGSILFNQLRNKVKTYDPTAAFATKVDASGNVIELDKQRLEEHLNSNQFDAKKVNAKSLKNVTFMEMAMETGNMKPDDLADLAKKSGVHAKNISDSLQAIVSEKQKNAAGNIMLDLNGAPIFTHQNVKENENDKNIHLAYMSSTGKVHGSLDSRQREEIFKKLDKDNAKNLSQTTINTHRAEIMEHINIGKFKEVVTNLKSDESKESFVAAVVAMPDGPRKKAFHKQIKKDPILAGMWP